MSPDGQFFWDGRQWVPTVTSDGRWRWNGGAWEPMTPINPNDPAGLAQMLSAQADETYAQAGALLAARRTEWAADPNTQGLLAQADQAAGAVQSDSAQLAAMNQQNVINRALGGSDRKRIEADLAGATAALRALIIQIGRLAPAVTFPDADGLLAAARNTEAQANAINAALAEQQQAESNYASRLAGAQQQLLQAEGGRASALATSAAVVQSAQTAYEQALTAARAHLGEARMPGAGEGVATCAGAALYGNHVQTADGRGLTAGCEVHAGTATQLLADHRDAAVEAMALSSAGAPAFHEAETQKSGAVFLLIRATGLTSIVAVPVGQEEAAAAFAAQASAAGKAGGSTAGDREAAVRAAQAELDRVTADRAAVDAAEAEHRRLEEDPALLGAVEAARAAVASAQADTAEVESARGRLAALVTAASAPPAPLGGGAG